MNCCRTPNGFDEMFDDRIARADARRYLRRGLPLRAQRLLDGLRDVLSFENVSSLEVGGGAGGLSVELLRQGVREATLIDASPAYVNEARRVAAECSVADRIKVQQANYAELANDDSFDLIVFDRVVCCFPDWQALLRPATRQATRAIALTYPRGAKWVSLLIRAVNLGMRAMRRTFRLQHHSPAAMHSFLEESGFQPRVTGYRGLWEIVVATRRQPRARIA